MYSTVAGMLQSGELLPVTVTGSCMTPLLRKGQRLVVQKQARYFTGDILVFAAAGGELLVHRYLGPAPGGRLMTKADAGERIDALVLHGEVFGRVLSADGVNVAVSIGSRARAMQQYSRWLGKLLVRRVQRQKAFWLPLD